MNRDERKTRPRALPPRQRMSGDRVSLYPSEAGGGTWIGVNDAGLVLALINWYAMPQKPADVSRGIVIPHLLAAPDLKRVAAALGELPLTRLNPFRLVAFSAREQAIREWRWDGARLSLKRHAWTRRHWFSSGYDEALVNRKRRPLARKIAATPQAIRALHRGHAPERGPLSVCMHRDEAESVSYTEILLTRNDARLRYAAGAPCIAKNGKLRKLAMARSPKPQPR